MSGFTTAVPSNTICGGKDGRGNNMYAMITKFNGQWMPGYFSFNVGAWVSSGGNMYSVTQYQVCRSSCYS